MPRVLPYAGGAVKIKMPPTSTSAAVSVRHHRAYDRLCRQLAAELGAPLLQADEPPATPFHLELDRHGLALHGDALPPNAPLRIRLDAARPRIGAGADPLHKAVGARAKTVIDATAGWGADAAHLARRGCRVIAVEQNPLVAVMLQHAHAACRDDAVKTRLEIVHGDSLAYLCALSSSPDVVYLDPMYPPKSKSAAAKKPLAILRMLAGPAGDSEALFAQAMACATQRVVVKRSRRAAPLYAGRVGEVGGKLVRFDIYRAGVE